MMMVMRRGVAYLVKPLLLRRLLWMLLLVVLVVVVVLDHVRPVRVCVTV
jgi:hypothetical protein